VLHLNSPCISHKYSLPERLVTFLCAAYSSGHYQHPDYPAYGSSSMSSTTTPLGFSGWRMCSNALMSFAQTTPLGSSNGNIVSVNRNGFHQNSSPYATTIWANYVPSNQSCYYTTSYGPPAAAATIHPELQATSFHNNNNNQQERDLGA
jgi:hypothetical protein